MNHASGQTTVCDVLILGAGPAGLTAGYLLTKAGYAVTIVERDPEDVGGISRTVSYKGYRFDIGGHRFFSKSREVVDLWNELLPTGFIERDRLSRIHYDGRFFSYPLKAFEALRNLGPRRSARCLLSYLRWRAFPHREPRTFAEWVTNQFGRELYETFFRTYTEKVWGMRCDEISAEWAAQRIKGLSLGGAIADALRRSLAPGGARRNDGMAAKTLLETFRYPRLGPGMLWEAARDRILAQGGALRMGTTVAEMSHDAARERWRITLDGAEPGQVEARHVVSSAPLRELARMLRPLPGALPHAEALRYRDFVTVALMIRGADLFPDNWIYVHDPEVRVGRVQNFSNWSPDMVPDADASCLGLEYFCFEGDGLWAASDADLVALATRELAALGLARAEDVFDGCVVRQPKAYPVYDDAYRAHLDALRSELERVWPTLHLVGRNGMHKYNNQDHAMMTAMLTVRNIAAGRRLYDVWGVNEDAEYHEAGVEGAREALGSERLVPVRAA